MSRSGYCDDDDDGRLALWRGTIASATRGRRGQKFFRDLVSALDAMPNKRLVANELQRSDGEVCALGAIGAARGIDMSAMDTEDWGELGATFDLAPSLAREVMWENDEAHWNVTPEERWKHVRAWAVKQISDNAERERLSKVWSDK